MTWTCRTCDGTLYGLPLGPHCSVVVGSMMVATISGPAGVRISNRAQFRDQPFDLPPLPDL